LEPERERVVNLAPSKTTGSAVKCSFSSKQKRWIALGIAVAVVVVVLAVVIATVVNNSKTPVPVDRQVSNPTLVVPSSVAPITTVVPSSEVNTAAADTDTLRQRYALSTLWFNPTPAGFGTDDNSHANTWITDRDECDWLGVTCNAFDEVANLYLATNNVRGRIPDDLGLLTAMTDLQLWRNQMTGTIPSSLGAMTGMVYLDLGINLFAGTIPSSLGTFTGLRNLILHTNELNGTIPSSLGQLTAMTNFGLNTNKLTGTIPSSFGALMALTTSTLYNNELNGTVPLCSLNRTFVWLIADCAKVSCPCCTHCCPTASEDGTIPVYEYC
jgi:hypothetical protein